MSQTVSGDDVSIIVGIQQISGWENIQITRSAEAYPSVFSFVAAETNTAPGTITAPVASKCQITIGNDLVLTGYVDRYAAKMSASSHQIEVAGSGLGEDLVDCSADILSPDSVIFNGQVSASSAVDLITKICQPHGIKVRSKLTDVGQQIQAFQVAAGETPYEIIQRVAHFAGFLVMEDTDGAMILDRIGSNNMASGFSQGANVESATNDLNVQNRMSKLTVIWSTTDSLSQGAAADPHNNRAEQIDPLMTQAGRFRPLIVVSGQVTNIPDYAKKLAAWDMGRRIGRSAAVTLTCDSWRDSAGNLWTPNYLAPVNLPALKLVNAQWVIASVTYRKDESGTHADLVLMPPDAFSIEPKPTTMFDNEIGLALPPGAAGGSGASGNPFASGH